jgi:hypothetical protein
MSSSEAAAMYEYLSAASASHASFTMHGRRPRHRRSNTPRSSYVYGSDREVHELATEHHGITNDTLWARGRAIEVVLGWFIADCIKLQQHGGQLAAYAIEFDATIIYCELERLSSLHQHVYEPTIIADVSRAFPSWNLGPY